MNSLAGTIGPLARQYVVTSKHWPKAEDLGVTTSLSVPIYRSCGPLGAGGGIVPKSAGGSLSGGFSSFDFGLVFVLSADAMVEVVSSGGLFGISVRCSFPPG